MVQRSSHQGHWWHAAIAWASIVAPHSGVIDVARSKSECCVCVRVCVCVVIMLCQQPSNRNSYMELTVS